MPYVIDNDDGAFPTDSQRYLMSLIATRPLGLSSREMRRRQERKHRRQQNKPSANPKTRGFQ